MEKPPHVDYTLFDTDLAERFRPNLLFSSQGFSECEIKIFTTLTTYIKDKNPYYTAKGLDADILSYASANLINSAFRSKNYSQVSVDIEFLRLLDIITDCMDGFIHAKPTNLNRIIDRLIFHSSVRNGNFHLLPKIPIQANDHFIDLRGGSYAMIAFLFIVCHELEHLNYLKNPEDLTEMEKIMAEEGKDFIEYYANNLLDFKYLVQKISAPSTEKKFNKFSFQDVINAEKSVLTEMICDQGSFAFTLAFVLRTKLPIRDLLTALLAIEFTQALLEITTQLTTLISKSAEFALQPDKLNNLSLRELVFHSFSSTMILNFTKEADKSKIAFAIDAHLATKNRLMVIFAKKIWERLNELAGTPSQENYPNYRKLITEWGFRHSRISLLCSNPNALNKMHPTYN